MSKRKEKQNGKHRKREKTQEGEREINEREKDEEQYLTRANIYKQDKEHMQERTKGLENLYSKNTLDCVPLFSPVYLPNYPTSPCFASLSLYCHIFLLFCDA